MKYQKHEMELSHILPVEITCSTGWYDDYVLPDENVADLHDCLELAVSDGYNQIGGCSSPETEVSIDNVTSWLDEIQEDVPEVKNKELFSIFDVDLLSEDFDKPILPSYNEPSYFEVAPITTTMPHIEEVSMFSKDLNNNRRKQRIVPLCDTDRFEQEYVSISGYQTSKLKNKTEFFDIMDAAQTEHQLHSRPDREIKEEPKVRRKRGLSRVEKQDRKKESNRNASYRYRQRKKMEKDSFVQYSVALKEQLETAKRSYYETTDELLRYIKHANLIRAVKDECSQLLLT